jgi:glycyl-tRNA synthetase
MKPLYDVNGLMFWDAREVRLREQFRDHFAATLGEAILDINPGFRMYGCEAPLLTPRGHINPNYTEDDIFAFPGDSLVLRPETTPGSYHYARHLIDSRTVRPPFCIWQYGKSFRREQDQVTKNMRLKEFYQQEFQFIFTDDTANDYHSALLEPARAMIAEMVGLPTRVADSDRLPNYSQITKDIEVDNGEKWMEVASISRRTDFPGKATFQTKKGAVERGLLVVEVAVGLDRCIYNFLRRSSSI